MFVGFFNKINTYALKEHRHVSKSRYNLILIEYFIRLTYIFKLEKE